MIQLQVASDLSANPVQVQDQDGNLSALWLTDSGDSASLTIAGPGGAGANCAINLSTYPPTIASTNVQIAAVDNGNGGATVTISLNLTGSNGGALTPILVLNSDGTVSLPNLANLPPQGSPNALLMVDSNGQLAVGTVSANVSLSIY